MLAMGNATPGSTEWCHAIGLEDSLLSWIEMTSAFVVSLPSAMGSNNSKPYQMRLIRAAGFDVPDTLVTTDVTAVLELWEKHHAIIYKSVSGVRSIVSRLTADHRDRLCNVANCPTQFQQYVEGTDFRVHIVGDDLFACEICSAAADYRYPDQQGGPVQIRSGEIPAEIAERCYALAAALNLPFTGIDLRRTPAGRWYCFEANPCPGFTFYENATGQPISAAVAALLVSSRNR
jgi:glutathione synthase/RimK-type ligase-like ATP-grasp enzyme